VKYEILNSAGSTVWSRTDASVAVPVSWSELGRMKSANAFTIPTVRRRLQRNATDPWKRYFAIRQRIGSDALRFFA
jgi:bifunctional non-homologous end joining protein LigD